MEDVTIVKQKTDIDEVDLRTVETIPPFGRSPVASKMAGYTVECARGRVLHTSIIERGDGEKMRSISSKHTSVYRVDGGPWVEDISTIPALVAALMTVSDEYYDYWDEVE